MLPLKNNDFLSGLPYKFPSVNQSDEDGLLAVGGDLHPDRLLKAYASGIFPWFSEGQPILWWSPNPRFVLYPEKLKISKSMRAVLKKDSFQVTFDTAFPKVIQACKEIERPDQAGTWITDDMVVAYQALHKAGFAHSVEVWQNEQLVGGLYGISLGSSFFGESMFSRVSNASKVAFTHLVKFLTAHEFKLIDCQVHTEHLESLGAEMIDRSSFLTQVEKGLCDPTLLGKWH